MKRNTIRQAPAWHPGAGVGHDREWVEMTRNKFGEYEEHPDTGEMMQNTPCMVWQGTIRNTPWSIKGAG